MNSPKKEDQLNLSMDITPQERAKSEELETGFDPLQDTWEVIVKYQGSLDAVREMGGRVEKLIDGYAILTLPADMVDWAADLYQIEYMEKPKRLYFELVQALAASCILPVTLREPYLTGKGVLLAVLDTGIDYRSSAFRNPDGTTRYWDYGIRVSKHPRRTDSNRRRDFLRAVCLMKNRSIRHFFRTGTGSGFCPVWIHPGMGRQ